jgi:hypothetical protein
LIIDGRVVTKLDLAEILPWLIQRSENQRVEIRAEADCFPEAYKPVRLFHLDDQFEAIPILIIRLFLSFTKLAHHSFRAACFSCGRAFSAIRIMRFI